jgi:hypothetical protein
MGEREAAAIHGRTVFHDTRNAGRRLGVTHHPEDGIVVLSLWQGELCTGSFRLPIDDAPRMIGVLADALTEHHTPPPAPTPTPTPTTAKARFRLPALRRVK